MPGRTVLTLAGLIALGAAPFAVEPAAAVTAPPRPVAATPRAVATPIPLHTPGDASAAGRRRLRAENAVEEGFLLGLPGAGPKGPTAYVPPEPRSSTGDAASLLLAGVAGLLAAVGSGALLLFALLRPRRAPETPAARASVALPPGRSRDPAPPGRRRRTAKLPQEVFDRLPPLLQLAVLDHAGPAPEPGPETGAATPPAG